MTALPQTITVIGGGIMGEALIAGWIAQGAVTAAGISVVERSADRRETLAAQHGVRVVAAASEVLPAADAVVIAVKPQVIDAVLGEIGEHVRGSLIISIAAGISCARIESLLPAGTAVVRVMPNIAVRAREGMAIVSGGSEASEEQIEGVRLLMEAVGGAIVLEERLQNAATAISGSGPAYFALVVDALARAGVSAGLTRAVAEQLAIRAMKGAAATLEEFPQHPEAFIDAVASPGGTTIAAITELEAHGVRAAFADAVLAAEQRAEELG